MFTKTTVDKKIWSIFLFNLCVSAVCSQDTTTKKVQFDIKTDLWGMQIFEHLNAPARMPGNIRYRRSSSINAPSDFHSVTDNPLRHGAYFAHVKTVTSVSPVFKLKADIYGELRGVSYGVFNTNNMIVFPVITAFVNDTVSIFRKKIIVKGKVGHFLIEQLDEGLLIYNLDVQGIQAEFGTNRWKLTYTLYGDLYSGIGLNIDDFHSISIKRHFANKNDALLGISLYMIAPPRVNKTDHFVWSFMGRKNTKTSVMYFQAGYRNVNKQDMDFKKDFIGHFAVTVGHKFNLKSNHFEYNHQTEFRFYGKSFNKNNYIEGVKYRRDLNQQPLFANSIGPFLYPLRKFETPFGQWSVFTEYQGLNIAGFNFLGNLRYKHSPKTEMDLGYDLNAVFCGRDTVYSSTANNNFFYPFFTLTFYYKPATNVKIGIMLTNKAMNLDMSYPTLYLYKNPYFGLKLSTSF